MSICDVDAMEREHQKSQKVESFKEKVDDMKIKKKLLPKGRKYKFEMNRPAPAINPQLIQEFKERREEEKEVLNGVKEGIFKIASRPIAEGKRELLKSKLEQSKYLNGYIDRHLFPSMIDYFNEHGKAVAVYAYNYMNVLKDSSAGPVVVG